MIRDAEIERLQQQIQELESLHHDSPDEKTESDPSVWDDGDDGVNHLAGLKRDRREGGYRDDLLRNFGVKIDVVVDHVNDIELPQYDEAEYAEDDVSPVLIWQRICLPLTQDSDSMDTVQGKFCHFVVDSYSQKQLSCELKRELIDPIIENWSSEKYVFNHVNMVRHAIKNTGINYLGPLNDQEVVEPLLHDYTTVTNMTDRFSTLAAIFPKPRKACDDAFADLYKNASRQEINVKASRIRMIRGKFKKVVWDKNIHFSKWKRRLLKILLKIKQTRGRVFFKRGRMMQGI